ncbi:MAG: hypothetical protein ACF8AM_06030 [Rhodopirellula sp. JB055]|uniref:hypothetical protein n=1 Tax=Rhodopirellula sp. JB055 TaxID=3342846 RepID=UPI00370CB499
MATADSSESNVAPTNFVLLRNDRVLRGNVQVADESVVIRRGGSEIRLPAKEVIGARDSLESLFELRQKWRDPRTSARPLMRALSAARWCVDHGLHSQAVQQLMLVYRLDPDNTEAKHLESRLRNAVQPDESHSTSSEVHQANYVEMSNEQVATAVSTNGDERPYLAESSEENTPIDRLHRDVMNSWLLHAFTARVQPILLARCAQCHDQNWKDEVGDFHLNRPIHSSRPTRQITEANLREILKHCVPGDPAASPLLKMAKQDHGLLTSVRPPNTSLPPDSALFKTLHSFVDQLPTLSELPAPTAEPIASQARNEHPNHPIAMASHLEGASVPNSSLGEIESVADWTPFENHDAGLPPNETSSPSQTDKQERERPRRLPKVERPLSEDLFNRQTELIELFRGTLTSNE